ncbi:LamG-like jellyroll fold domain-containing protein [Bdellovibrio sp. HCB185ZH]|uniref:LamG-like jellyroll fold domain-containing protein n=1 Tax=Bdellovibrio sp. HCB185ZH TaxID=3394235 RepID=UPI0039A601BA
MVKKIFLLYILTPAVALAQTSAMTGALLDAGTPNRCAPIYKSAWLPQSNSLIASYNFDGSPGTITNGATIKSITGSYDATAANPSSTLSYTNHAATPSPLANLRQHLTTTGNDGDIISVSGLPAQSAGTWSFWINMAIPVTNHQRIFYRSDNNGNQGYFFLIRTEGILEFHKVYSGGNQKIQTCPVKSSYFFGSWHQVVVTWAGGTAETNLKIFVDGTELVYTGVADPRIDATHDCDNWSLYNGRASAFAGSGSLASEAAQSFYLSGLPASTSTNPSSKGIIGKLDEFAIWNVALSPAEVLSLYRQQKCN